MRNAAKHVTNFAARKVLRAAWLAALLALPAAVYCQSSGNGNGSQQLGANQTSSPMRPMPMDSSPFDSMGPRDSAQFEKRLDMLNADRQKTLVNDTNKLLALVKELNDEVAGSNSGALTPDQLRKLVEIEKLAHNVRDKMSLSVRETAPNLDMGPYLPPMMR